MDSPPGRRMVIGPATAFSGTFTVSDWPEAATEVGVAVAPDVPNCTVEPGTKPEPTIVVAKPFTRVEPASLDQPVMTDGVTWNVTDGLSVTPPPSMCRSDVSVAAGTAS